MVYSSFISGSLCFPFPSAHPPTHPLTYRYDDAVRCYLQALKLNPEAGHIWGYLRVTFTSMERFDLVQLAGQQDPSLFDGEFRTTLG